MDKTRSSLRKISCVAVALIGCAIILTKYLNNQISLAEVLVKSRPVSATRDLSALLEAQPDTSGRPIESQIGRITIDENTKCRLLRYESQAWCPAGKANPVKVELLEGPNRGQAVWVCSDQVRRLHPLLP
jgi:hypothetical protein